jgi:ParB family chromosome partitioning protein
MKTQSGMLNLWQMILNHDLSVRGAEAIVNGKTKARSNAGENKPKQKNATVRQLEDEMITILGTKVTLNHKGEKGGSIVVNYFSADDLERLLDLLRSIE